MPRKQKATHTCCARVYSRGFMDMRGHACGVGARHEVNGKRYCKTHSPEIVKEKHDKRMEAYRDKRERRNTEQDLRNRHLERAERALEIVRQIAAGHNDPRQLALSLLQEYSDLD